METRDILIVGSILLCCAGFGLTIVRLSNPYFKGLGWLGCSFAAGALGAALLAVPFNDPRLGLITAYTLILAGYVLLHACILELLKQRSRLPTLGLVLLALQPALFLYFCSIQRGRQLSIVAFGFLLTAQALQTALTLKRDRRKPMLPPIWFTIVLLAGFAAFNSLRSILVFVVGTPQSRDLPNPLQVTSVIVFLGIGLGIGFGVFWMAGVEARMALVHLANTDPLTGVFNRRSFVEWCERELTRSARTREPFSLIMIDVDHFKQINDLYGHTMGDAALCAVAARLKESVRSIDVLGRWGGEEFVALLPGAGADAAMLIAQRLRQSVETLAIEPPKAGSKPGGKSPGPIGTMSGIKSSAAAVKISVTISLGVVTCAGHTHHVDHIDELFHGCDEALYQAKAEGRNRIVQTFMEEPDYSDRNAAIGSTLAACRAGKYAADNPPIISTAVTAPIVQGS